ncbi:MAG: helix-turn-helix domain-containing protein [Candidatus Yanofskybacteria bacterium]|nr:helix-turn-helix domain-containing protein [Candidatus Yanofskybacteria bacterium]
MRIYTIQEVAKILRCSERQVFRYLANGKLNGSKQGKWRFTDNDIRKFLNLGKVRVRRRSMKK